jgi:glycosyltransferase involved in cell wall biosynthesis
MFLFVNYCTPNWYFNLLKAQNLNCYLVNYDNLDQFEKSLIDYDENYSSKEVSLLDASYQALKKGINLKVKSNFLSNSICEPSIADNYRFITKYYGFPWVIFVFFIRMLSLKKPVNEILGFLKCLNVKRVDLYKSVNPISLLEFNSGLLKAAPFVSVIIPTLNRYEYLERCITDLEKQKYKYFELIVVDQSEPYQPSFYENRNIEINLIRQETKGLWMGRNNAIRKAKGEYILLYDDDSIIEPNWIEMHLKCIDFFNVNISSGVSLAAVGSKIPKSYSFYRWADQIDTGNVLIKKDIFRKIGLFDEQFEGMRLGDGEFGFRSFLNSIAMISNPEACRIHLKVETGGLRQMGSWDAFRPIRFFAPKPIPSVIYFYKRYLNPFNYRTTIFIGLLLSNIKYENKKHNIFLITSMIKSIFLFPLVLFQYKKSKKIATKMILEGPKIYFDI